MTYSAYQCIIAMYRIHLAWQRILLCRCRSAGSVTRASSKEKISLCCVGIGPSQSAGNIGSFSKNGRRRDFPTRTHMPSDGRRNIRLPKQFSLALPFCRAILNITWSVCRYHVRICIPSDVQPNSNSAVRDREGNLRFLYFWQPKCFPQDADQLYSCSSGVSWIELMCMSDARDLLAR
ncbi:hypothetical protein DL89DRAFT_33578 [Linderina pennispora]|uniref:Uncharacterized protein n=1 Tax=Linderina pennispora TaxID=61395 RepID=A0A1Y1W4U6_9FUNG|nr:uncharacterized protein DL89DRAFT_33578 [Linderina pennispora]ORX68418.1 hypothetical protein DL89DRAFT_33578 [Linderina pennispora]